MPRKVMARKDAKKEAEIDPPPDVFLKKVVPIATKMTPEDVEFIQANHVEGHDVVIHPCGRSARVNRPPEDSDDIFAYYDQFRLGLSFPICFELAEVLKHYGVVLAQLYPNSIASVMTFIVYLRRTNHSWSMEYFRRHFFCRISKTGYVSFPTTSALVVTGMEDRIDRWKEFFCKVSSPVDVDIPRKPSSQKISFPMKEEREVGDIEVKVLDIRQYVKDKRVLKKMIYPDKYVKLTAEEWEDSDKVLVDMPKMGHPYREPVGRMKSLAEVSTDIEIVGQIPEQSENLAGANIPSISGVKRGSEEVLSSTEEVPEEEERLLKRKILVKGKQPVVETSSEELEKIPEDPVPKVTLDVENDKVIVDLSKEWYPASACPGCTAQSMTVALYSGNLEEEVEAAGLKGAMDQLARHNAAAWCIGTFLGKQVGVNRTRILELEGKIFSQEKEILLLTRENEEKAKLLAMEQKEKDKQLILERIQNDLQGKTLNAYFFQRLAEELEIVSDWQKSLVESLQLPMKEKEKEHREEVETLRAIIKRLKTQVKDITASSAEDIRGGISLCLDQLSKANAILPEWNDAERIESLAMADYAKAGGSSVKEVVENIINLEDDDTEPTTKD